MNEYARARGRVTLPDPGEDAVHAPVIKRVLRQLSERENEIIGRRRALVHEFMPELVPEIAEMVKLGLIDGWRNVRRVEVFSTGEVA